MIPPSLSHKLSRLLATLAAGLLALPPVLATAASYPDRPIRLVTAFSGGISDTVAHTLGEALTVSLGQPVIVEANTGAGGNIGVRIAADAAADGHTLLLGGGWLYTNHLRQPNGYNDPDKNLQAIAPIVSMPYVWLAHPSCNCATLAELADRLGQSSEPLPYGSPGIGTPPHLLIEQWGKDTGGKLIHIPYRGGGALLNATISGEVLFSLVTITSALPHIRQGSLVPLGVTSAERSALLPDVPTVRELGFPTQEVSTWFGLFGPAGLPAGIAEKLARETDGALNSPRLQQTFAPLGAVPFGHTDQAGLHALLRAERERWTRIIGSPPSGSVKD